MREIGRGGFGVVYLATSPTGQRVAVKVLPLDARQPDALVARFQREIHAVAAMTHANFVRFHAAGRHDGPQGSYLWVALDYLEGKTLRELVNENRSGLRLEDVLNYCLQIADALAELHKLGVVHRDVKPENVMLVGGELIKVFDLGIAKVSGAQKTTGHVSVGTALYMAPEQFETGDRAAVGPWTDVYALGLVLYELATGKHPICPDEILSAAEIIARALMYTPPPLLQLLPAVSAELSAVAHKAIAKKAADRYRTMSELREALNGALLRQRLHTHAGSLAVVGGDWTPAAASPVSESCSARYLIRSASRFRTEMSRRIAPY